VKNDNQTSWLVDVGYIVKASEHRFRLDYVKAEYFLQERLQERYGLIRSYIFNGIDPAYGIPSGLQGFYDAMAQHGMHIRLQPMESGPPGTNRQRRVDVDLCAHLIWQAARSLGGTVVLSTGDQDFVPAVDLARQELGARIVLFTYSVQVHHDLTNAVDEWIHFEDYSDQLARQ